ncbi:malonyl-CoA synthase [Alisedimentitalea sp. MJ-SS2]|uniref:malonate--CoA ligase n=1 Tax=Aliisedimentitalea sp. MJ-SS2 TaxID=3049795 RepID=UPI00291481E2|nr:malonyl-CoA synthase [Alisedimentitalea sp. MJ-SS2]MDU8927209.1 malonyl-CoA synthase [Alisedimentitalea sp. MJ-SS2]
MYQGNYLGEAISKASDGRGDALFLEHGLTGQKITYDEFWAGAEKMAALLVQVGLQPGDRVAVQADKTVAMLELYVGTVLAGGVFLPLNTAYTPAEIEYFLTDAAPRVFVCDPSRFGAMEPIAARAGVTKVLTLAADESGTLITAQETIPAGFVAVPRDADDLAAILYTSGTTGRSKGAMLTHKALASNSETLRDYWQFTRDDVLIHALPIFHTHGLFVATNVTLMAGSSCLFLPGFKADKVIELMPSATALMGVPTFYTRLLDQPVLADVSKGMRLFVSGSAPLLAETHERWSAVTGHAILERYGMTETNMNTSNPYDGERRPGTVGFPLPGVELKICDPSTGEALEQGEIGVIEVRGPNVFAGYWQMPEKTAEELRENGWFITGDLGQIDDDGYVHIVGRGKDLIISGGFNVYPKEIEGVIDDLPGVNESAVIGVPHPDFGEGVVAVVVPEKGASVAAEDVMAGIGDKLAKFKQPKQVVILDELPRNTMGKVQKNVLRDEYAGLLS